MARFSLQDMVRQTLAAASEREKTAADESKKDEKSEVSGKLTTPKETGNTPERNYESVNDKTASVYVSKLASAVEYLNAHFLKEAVGKPEPPLSHSTPESPTGAGKGQTALETNLKSPTPGIQSENTGEAKTGKIPTTTGHDVKSPGQTNPETALETDRNSPPGGSENWTHQDKMKQAADSEKKTQEDRSFMTPVNKLRAKGRESKVVRGITHGLSGAALGGSAGAALHHVKGKAGGGLKGALIGAALGTGAGMLRAENAKGWRQARSEMGASEKKAEADLGRILGIMDKMAGEDVSSSHILAAHHDNPPDATKAEEGVPKLPGEASKQEALVGSNKAAINYTKQQAKAVPKARMGEVIDEPAQRKSTDPVLHENLDATSGAGVKLSSAEQVVAARALLRKIAEAGARDDASPEEQERAAQLHAAFKSKQEEKSASFGSDTMPIQGGY